MTTSAGESPAQNTDYAVIYSLSGPDGSSFHYGQTKSPKKILSGHRSKARTGFNSPLYAHMRSIGPENVKMDMVEILVGSDATSKATALEAQLVHDLKPSVPASFSQPQTKVQKLHPTKTFSDEHRAKLREALKGNGSASLGAHARWHRDRNSVNPNCKHCYFPVAP